MFEKNASIDSFLFGFELFMINTSSIDRTFYSKHVVFTLFNYDKQLLRPVKFHKQNDFIQKYLDKIKALEYTK